MTPGHVTWVVPCFEEATRLDGPAFLALADGSAPASLIFVDDGSRDGTAAMLRDLAAGRPEQIEVVSLPVNRGKAEAVRAGMLRALDGPAHVIGYVDADLATPPGELDRLGNLARAGNFDIVMGSRVQLLGRTIKRNSTRHYVGRVFATCASLSLGLPVYDTQCGAKLFRRTAALAAALADPFTSRWAFDVELLGRLVHPRPGIAPIDLHRIREEPLLVWTDVPGSKLHPLAALRGGLDLLRLALRNRRST
jgi:glycosyltransferase involved in cell wall biosynthesis